MARPKGRALEKRRAEEAARKAAAARSATRRRTAVIGVAAVLVVAAAVLLVALQPPAPGVAFPDQGNRHLASLDEPHAAYNSRPPSSGPHVGSLAAWAESDTQLPPELWVHNLEDGGVVLTYSCGSDCPELLEGLRGVLAEFEDERLILMPYADIVDPEGVSHRAAAVAWSRVFYFDELDEESADELGEFIRTFEGLDHHVRVNSPLGG